MNVYVGNFGAYPVPADVMAKAKKLNGKRRLTDKRTKGAKYLEFWGRSQDATHEAMLTLKKLHDSGKLVVL